MLQLAVSHLLQRFEELLVTGTELSDLRGLRLLLLLGLLDGVEGVEVG